MIERTAQCRCGQLRVIARGDPIRVSVCHCHECQRRSGSAFATQARFRDEQLTITGESHEWTQTGDEGGQAVFSFCPRCGSSVYYRAFVEPEVVAVAVGAFADREFPAPTRSVYENRQHPWVTLSGIVEHD